MQVAGGGSIYNSVAPAALGHWRMRFNRPVDAQAGEPPPQRAKAARWGPRAFATFLVRRRGRLRSTFLVGARVEQPPTWW
jgi:hypothetical protein